MTRENVNSEDGLALTADSLGQKNYLGDPDVVDQLVRGYLSSCLSLLSNFEDGTVGNVDDASGKLLALALKTAAVFMGEDPNYVAQPWNSPNRLGFYLRALKPPHMEDYARPADAYFAAIGTAAIQHSIAQSNGEISELESKEGLDMIRNDAIAALLGVREGASRAR